MEIFNEVALTRQNSYEDYMKISDDDNLVEDTYWPLTKHLAYRDIKWGAYWQTTFRRKPDDADLSRVRLMIDLEQKNLAHGDIKWGLFDKQYLYEEFLVLI